MFVVSVVGFYNRTPSMYLPCVVSLTSTLGLKEIHILNKLYTNVFQRSLAVPGE